MNLGVDRRWLQGIGFTGADLPCPVATGLAWQGDQPVLKKWSRLIERFWLILVPEIGGKNGPTYTLHPGTNDQLSA